jgi:hypothetical protein
MRRHWFMGAVAICLSLALSACDSAETRAEKHFQAALAHIEAGDVDRAIVELMPSYSATAAIWKKLMANTCG